MRMPFAMTLTGVRASVNTASSSGAPAVDINEEGTSVLSTKLTIDAGEKTSLTAAADKLGAVLTELPFLLRWPVTKAPGGATTIGPPQMLQPRGTHDGLAITSDGACSRYTKARSSARSTKPSIRSPRQIGI